MNKILLLSLILLLCQFLAGTVSDTLYVIHSTDVHGNLLAYDYYKDQPAERGLAKLYTFIRTFRADHENVILLDGGDMIQGTPLSFLYNHVETHSEHPLIRAMNLMEYSAMAVGNHEIEQGLPVCDRLRTESNFPWLSANSTLENGGTYFEPYTLISLAGLRIAVLGLTTPAIPKWLDPDIFKGIEWKDMVEISRNYISELQDKADIVIGLFHAGLESEGSYPDLPEENAAGLVADVVEGFDLILGGHSHRIFPPEKSVITDPLIPFQLISGSHGRNAGVIKLVVETTDGISRVVEKTGWIEPLDNYPASAEMEKLFAPVHQKVLHFIRQEVAETEIALTTADAYFSDNALIDLINQVQMEKSGAEISFASCFNPHLQIEPGPVMVKDIYTIYPYENFLYSIEMTGTELDAYLEYSARFFLLDDEGLLVDPEMEGYNYDIAEGISYSIDMSQPFGNRINGIKLLSSGNFLEPETAYTVALNSFRGSGGGGYLAELGINSPKIIYKSSQEIRNMIIEFLISKKDYKFAANSNWQIKLK